ncbi:sigma-70 family RNA polymerase sigma factor [Micromonospora terminaliae]|uniref:Sigma-70 family RNA polymerase sigma factor n=1 Tax=Micromonospora terminaliae TaxID=1914461 RepID=A0AAJ3DHZ6_9ACTN|nr:sigma-70 family RNA polymerase sigma factor [Micromonospora terminaliae]NES27137.1 sigma-70 family RNA polymerase sigma factor [Micromonospora terminaliae]QGL48098.1 sigma-70 family RNA polymerase sigma factor [Micromonospora terminaliae]
MGEIVLGAPDGSPAGRAERMTALHADHGRAVLRLLLLLTRDQPQTAEDLLQETMLRAWRHLDAVPDEPDAARRWLLTVARRLVIDGVRRRRVRPAEVHLVDMTWIPARDDTTGTALASHTVRRALRRLSPAQRSLLSEVFLVGRSPEEVAGRLGVPIGTVKSRTHHALRALRTGLKAA